MSLLRTAQASPGRKRSGKVSILKAKFENMSAGQSSSFRSNSIVAGSAATATTDGELTQLVHNATREVLNAPDESLSFEADQSINSFMRTLSGSSGSSSFSVTKAFHAVKRRMHQEKGSDTSASAPPLLEVQKNNPRKVSLGGNLQMDFNFTMPVDRVHVQNAQPSSPHPPDPVTKKTKKEAYAKAEKMLAKLDEKQKLKEARAKRMKLEVAKGAPQKSGVAKKANKAKVVTVTQVAEDTSTVDNSQTSANMYPDGGGTMNQKQRLLARLEKMGLKPLKVMTDSSRVSEPPSMQSSVYTSSTGIDPVGYNATSLGPKDPSGFVVSYNPSDSTDRSGSSSRSNEENHDPTSPRSVRTPKSTNRSAARAMNFNESDSEESNAGSQPNSRAMFVRQGSTRLSDYDAYETGNSFQNAFDGEDEDYPPQNPFDGEDEGDSQHNTFDGESDDDGDEHSAASIPLNPLDSDFTADAAEESVGGARHAIYRSLHTDSQRVSSIKSSDLEVHVISDGGGENFEAIHVGESMSFDNEDFDEERCYVFEDSLNEDDAFVASVSQRKDYAYPEEDEDEARFDRYAIDVNESLEDVIDQEADRLSIPNQEDSNSSYMDIAFGMEDILNMAASRLGGSNTAGKPTTFSFDSMMEFATGRSSSTPTPKASATVAGPVDASVTSELSRKSENYAGTFNSTNADDSPSTSRIGGSATAERPSTFSFDSMMEFATGRSSSTTTPKASASVADAVEASVTSELSRNSETYVGTLNATNADDSPSTNKWVHQLNVANSGSPSISGSLPSTPPRPPTSQKALTELSDYASTSADWSVASDEEVFIAMDTHDPHSSESNRQEYLVDPTSQASVNESSPADKAAFSSTKPPCPRPESPRSAQPVAAQQSLLAASRRIARPKLPARSKSMETIEPPPAEAFTHPIPIQMSPGKALFDDLSHSIAQSSMSDSISVLTTEERRGTKSAEMGHRLLDENKDCLPEPSTQHRSEIFPPDESEMPLPSLDADQQGLGVAPVVNEDNKSDAGMPRPDHSRAFCSLLSGRTDPGAAQASPKVTESVPSEEAEHSPSTVDQFPLLATVDLGTPKLSPTNAAAAVKNVDHPILGQNGPENLLGDDDDYWDTLSSLNTDSVLQSQKNFEEVPQAKGDEMRPLSPVDEASLEVEGGCICPWNEHILLPNDHPDYTGPAQKQILNDLLLDEFGESMDDENIPVEISYLPDTSGKKYLAKEAQSPFHGSEDMSGGSLGNLQSILTASSSSSSSQSSVAFNDRKDSDYYGNLLESFTGSNNDGVAGADLQEAIKRGEVQAFVDSPKRFDVDQGFVEHTRSGSGDEDLTESHAGPPPLPSLEPELEQSTIDGGQKPQPEKSAKSEAEEEREKMSALEGLAQSDSVLRSQDETEERALNEVTLFVDSDKDRNADKEKSVFFDDDWDDNSESELFLVLSRSNDSVDFNNPNETSRPSIVGMMDYPSSGLGEQHEDYSTNEDPARFDEVMGSYAESEIGDVDPVMVSVEDGEKDETESESDFDEKVQHLNAVNHLLTEDKTEESSNIDDDDSDNESENTNALLLALSRSNDRMDRNDHYEISSPSNAIAMEFSPSGGIDMYLEATSSSVVSPDDSLAAVGGSPKRRKMKESVVNVPVNSDDENAHSSEGNVPIPQVTLEVETSEPLSPTQQRRSSPALNLSPLELLMDEAEIILSKGLRNMPSPRVKSSSVSPPNTSEDVSAELHVEPSTATSDDIPHTISSSPALSPTKKRGGALTMSTVGSLFCSSTAMEYNPIETFSPPMRSPNNYEKDEAVVIEHAAVSNDPAGSLSRIPSPEKERFPSPEKAVRRVSPIKGRPPSPEKAPRMYTPPKERPPSPEKMREKQSAEMGRSPSPGIASLSSTRSKHLSPQRPPPTPESRFAAPEFSRRMSPGNRRNKEHGRTELPEDSVDVSLRPRHQMIVDTNDVAPAHSFEKDEKGRKQIGRSPRLESVLARVELRKKEKLLRLEQAKDIPTMEATLEEYDTILDQLVRQNKTLKRGGKASETSLGSDSDIIKGRIIDLRLKTRRAMAAVPQTVDAPREPPSPDRLPTGRQGQRSPVKVHASHSASVATRESRSDSPASSSVAKLESGLHYRAETHRVCPSTPISITMPPTPENAAFSRTPSIRSRSVPTPRDVFQVNAHPYSQASPRLVIDSAMNSRLTSYSEMAKEVFSPSPGREGRHHRRPDTAADAAAAGTENTFQRLAQEVFTPTSSSETLPAGRNPQHQHRSFSEMQQSLLLSSPRRHDSRNTASPTRTNKWDDILKKKTVVPSTSPVRRGGRPSFLQHQQQPEHQEEIRSKTPNMDRFLRERSMTMRPADHGTMPSQPPPATSTKATTTTTTTMMNHDDDDTRNPSPAQRESSWRDARRGGGGERVPYTSRRTLSHDNNSIHKTPATRTARTRTTTSTMNQDRPYSPLRRTLPARASLLVSSSSSSSSSSLSDGPAAADQDHISSPERRRLLGSYISDQTKQLKRDLDLARLSSHKIRTSNVVLSSEMEAFKAKLSQHARSKRGERAILGACQYELGGFQQRLRNVRGKGVAAAQSGGGGGGGPTTMLGRRSDSFMSDMTIETAWEDFSEIRSAMLTNLKLMHDAQERLMRERFRIQEHDDQDAERLMEIQDLMATIQRQEKYDSDMVRMALGEAERIGHKHTR